MIIESGWRPFNTSAWRYWTHNGYNSQCVVARTLSRHLLLPSSILFGPASSPNQLLRALWQNVGPHTQMVVVVVLWSNSKEKYDHVKKYLCVAFPVPSQCVVARTLNWPQVLMSVAQRSRCRWRAGWAERSGMWLDKLNRCVESVNSGLTQTGSSSRRRLDGSRRF